MTTPTIEWTDTSTSHRIGRVTISGEACMIMMDRVRYNRTQIQGPGAKGYMWQTSIYSRVGGEIVHHWEGDIYAAPVKRVAEIVARLDEQGLRLGGVRAADVRSWAGEDGNRFWIDSAPTDPVVNKSWVGLVDEEAGGVVAYFASEEDAQLFIAAQETPDGVVWIKDSGERG